MQRDAVHTLVGVSGLQPVYVMPLSDHSPMEPLNPSRTGAKYQPSTPRLTSMRYGCGDPEPRAGIVNVAPDGVWATTVCPSTSSITVAYQYALPPGSAALVTTSSGPSVGALPPQGAD